MPKLKNLHATPEAVEHALYEALEHADVEAFMQLWADDEEIVCVPPGGPRLVGPGKIREVWREILANGPIRVRPVQTNVAQGAMVSVHSLVVQLLVDVPAPGSAAAQSARRTAAYETIPATAPGTAYGSAPAGLIHMNVSNIYFKGPHGWRLILHHSSVSSEDYAGDGAAHSAGAAPNVLH